MYSQDITLRENGELVRIFIPSKVSNIALTLLLDNYLGTFLTAITKRQALYKIGLLDESLLSCQDLSVWLKLTWRFKLITTRKPLVYYYSLLIVSLQVTLRLL